jgi:hypothetical protein
MNKMSHRQGIIIKNTNSGIKEGELIQIVSEEKENYLIRRCYAFPVEKVSKNNIRIV